jgi:biotin carboxyl carrier protein
MAGLDGPGATTPLGPTGSGAVRVSFPGRAGNGETSLVVEIGTDGQPVVDAAPESVTLEELGRDRHRLVTPVASHGVLIAPIPHPAGRATGVERLEVVIDGWRFEVDLEPEARARLRERATSARAGVAHGGPLEVRAIIPGRVVSVDVATGDAIDAGGRLLVVEAMKMQNELRSPRAGTISRVAVGPGQTVDRGDLLVVVE